MIRRLPRNRKFDGGMLYGGTGSTDVVVWISPDVYNELGKPTKIRVDVHAEKRNTVTKVKHEHRVTYE